MNTVACVWKTGGDFTLEYVIRLYAGALTHMPDLDFVCLTDAEVPALPRLRVLPLTENWSGWWSKLELFDKLRNGRVIYFDLDTVIRKPLTPLLRFEGFTMLSDLGNPRYPASGAMAWDGDYSYLHAAFKANPVTAMAEPGGDQVFIARNLGHDPRRFQSLCPGFFASYKRASTDELAAAGVVCYHGKPRPHTTGWAAGRRVLDPYATHLSVLEPFMDTFKPASVFEFGTGLYSTALFLRCCRAVTSVEMQDRHWFDRITAAYKNAANHKCVLALGAMPAVELLNADTSRYDLVFVDGHGDSRWAQITAACAKTDTVIVHDTQQPCYSWERAKLPGHWHAVDIPEGHITTSVLTARSTVYAWALALPGARVSPVFGRRPVL